MKLFQNPMFRARIEEAAQVLKEEGIEVGFRVLRKPKTLKITPLFKGTADKIVFPPPIPKKEERYATFHFHIIEGAIIPTKNDLLHLAKWRKNDIFALHYKTMMIGQLNRKDRKVTILVVKCKKIVTPGEIMTWEEDGKCLPESEQTIINKKLEGMGFRVSLHLISLERRG